MTANNSSTQLGLVLSAEDQRFKELLRKRLIECGWRDEVRMLCREIAKENDSKDLTLDNLVSMVTPHARALVPDAVKKELLQEIKTHLLAQNDLLDDPEDKSQDRDSSSS